MRLLAPITLTLSVLLSACGGGGGTPPGPGPILGRAWTQLPANAGNWALSHAGHDLHGTRLVAGELHTPDGELINARGVLRFRIDIPGGSTIDEATLHISQQLVVGRPHALFGTLKLHHVRFGEVIDSRDFHAPSLGSLLLFPSPDLGNLSISLLSFVRRERERGSEYLDLMIRFDPGPLAGDTNAVWLAAPTPGDSPRPYMTIRVLAP